MPLYGVCNAGKSSLVNAMWDLELESGLAPTSHIPHHIVFTVKENDGSETAPGQEEKNEDLEAESKVQRFELEFNKEILEKKKLSQEGVFKLSS
jgi:hypothetical protein